jgi:hypothetical protein
MSGSPAKDFATPQSASDHMHASGRLSIPDCEKMAWMKVRREKPVPIVLRYHKE